MEQIHIKIGKNINRIRKSRGLSLDKVSQLTGVSKAMLAQIERGDSNPTISVIWKIANGLRLSFTSLIEEEEKFHVSVVSPNELEPLSGEEGHYRAYPLFPFDPNKQFEIYIVELDPGYSHESEPHNEGVEEYILDLEGTLTIEMNQATYTLEPRNAIHFAANQTHIYQNNTNQVTRFYALIFYPS